jgi:aldehyde dehydrogenase (NAD+)
VAVVRTSISSRLTDFVLSISPSTSRTFDTPLLSGDPSTTMAATAKPDAPPPPPQQHGFVDVADVPALVRSVRAVFDSGRTKPLSWRLAQLRGVRRLLLENVAAIEEALRLDLGRPRLEALMAEVHASVPEADAAITNLARWAADETVATPPALMPASSCVQRQPLGVVLIISPWNYPISLAINSAIAAIAAGNACIIKPSEVAPRSAQLMAALVPRYLDAQAVRVALGAVPETTALLRERFDGIVYTGSTAVGKVVMRAAAEHLTPCVLELGGKSPCLVDASADLDAAARAIVWGRCLNAGQTCVAPDYVLVDKRVEEALVARIGKTIAAYYGARVAESPDFGRIVSDGHFKRVSALLHGDHGGVVAFGGETDAATRFVAPTVIRNPRQDSALMRDEIFGPLLPVIGVDSVQQGVAQWVQPREKPLALYLFSRTSSTVRWVMENTTSGGLSVNDVVMQLTNPDLPFGGVGASGMGAYHGRAGFEAMSHRRSVLKQSTLLNVTDMVRSPPYGKKYDGVHMLLGGLPGALPLPPWKDSLIAALALAVAVLSAKVAGKF